MKKTFFTFITLLTLTSVFLLAGYSKQKGVETKDKPINKEEEIRLLEGITYDETDGDGGTYIKFEYDDQNRLISVNGSTLIYDGNDLISYGNTKKRETKLPPAKVRLVIIESII